MSTAATTLKPQSAPHPRDAQIDTVKFLLIFSIFIFHFEGAAGPFYPLVNIYQVSIFFLISGFWALDRIDKPILRFVCDAFKKYIVYWLFWVVIYTAYHTIANSLSARKALDLFVRYFSGVRATGIEGMWFTPAFFFVSFAYFLLAKGISKICKLPKTALAWVCCGLAFVFFYLTKYIWPISPKLIFSLGTVPEYLLCFSLGAVAYIYISAYKEKVKTSVFLKIIGCLITFAAFINFLLYFFKKENLAWGWCANALEGKLSFLPDLITVLLMFVLLSCIARYISCDFTAKIGQNTLGLCHCEMFVKGLLRNAGSLLGLTVKATNPIGTILFAFGALVVGCYAVLPAADRITKRIISVKSV